jgi:D-arabinose 5-phosphate isomerase GutQ
MAVAELVFMGLSKTAMVARATAAIFAFTEFSSHQNRAPV